jgi:hypothetical protein
MNKHALLLGTASLLAGLAAATTGCQQDPDKPSRYVQTGAAGSSATTGAGGTAGSNGTGAGGSNGMGPIVGSAVAAFDTTTEGFALDNYHDTLPKVNLGDPMSGLGVTPTLTWDGTQGSPTPGSLQVMAPYSGANQYVLAQRDFGTANPQNWMGKTIHVRIKVTSGMFKGGAQVFVKTGTKFSFGGQYTNLAMNSNWQEVTLVIGSPMSYGDKNSYDPSQVVQYGVELNSGDSGAGSGPVTFNIDSFSVDPPFPPSSSDAGGDAPAATDAGGGSDASGGGDTGGGSDAAAGQ